MVIGYNPQGIAKEAFFQLAKESFLQAEMFWKHSSRILCIDSTHKTNPYGFKLVTIIVPDEFKNGKLKHCYPL